MWSRLLHDYICVFSSGQVIWGVNTHKFEAANSLHCWATNKNCHVVSWLSVSEAIDWLVLFMLHERWLLLLLVCNSPLYADSSSLVIWPRTFFFHRFCAPQFAKIQIDDVRNYCIGRLQFPFAPRWTWRNNAQLQIMNNSILLPVELFDFLNL